MTVEDREAPVAGNPADIVVPTDPGVSTAAVTWPALIVTDNVEVTSLVCSHSSGDVFPLGTITVSCTAGDAAGNTTDFSFTVTVEDREAPFIEGLPSDIVTGVDAGATSAVVTWTEPQATDNVAVTGFSGSHSPGDSFPVGVTTVTYTAEDAAGNVTTASFTISVGDDEAPVITGMPDDIVTNTDPGLGTAVISWTAPEATDNVGVVQFNSTHNPGTAFPAGVTTVAYTATDAAGNSTSASFTVTVNDE